MIGHRVPPSLMFLRGLYILALIAGWWKAQTGGHDFNYAGGHGEQLIVIVHDLDLVVVTTAGNLVGQMGGAAWQKEKAVLDLVTGFVSSLPSG